MNEKNFASQNGGSHHAQSASVTMPSQNDHANSFTHTQRGEESL
jgi:hypothetical protein